MTYKPLKVNLLYSPSHRTHPVVLLSHYSHNEKYGYEYIFK